MGLKDFLDCVDSPGGDITIMFTLALIGFFTWMHGFEGGKELYAFGTGALAHAMRAYGKDNSNGDKNSP